MSSCRLTRSPLDRQASCGGSTCIRSVAHLGHWSTQEASQGHAGREASRVAAAVPTAEGRPAGSQRSPTVLTVGDVEACSGAPPSATVLATFDLYGRPKSLAGGQGASWLVGQVVLKPLDMPLAARQWQGELPTRLDSREDLRVSVPLLTARGQWSSHDWTAWRYEPGEHLPGRWPDVVEAGRRLHAALQDEPEPAFLSSRSGSRPRAWSVRNSLCRPAVVSRAPHQQRRRGGAGSRGRSGSMSRWRHVLRSSCPAGRRTCGGGGAPILRPW